MARIIAMLLSALLTACSGAPYEGRDYWTGETGGFAGAPVDATGGDSGSPTDETGGADVMPTTGGVQETGGTATGGTVTHTGGRQTGGEATGGEPETVCEAGRQVTCPCPGGADDGVRSCSADGMVWGACECQEPGTGGAPGNGPCTLWCVTTSLYEPSLGIADDVDTTRTEHAECPDLYLDPFVTCGQGPGYSASVQCTIGDSLPTIDCPTGEITGTGGSSGTGGTQGTGGAPPYGGSGVGGSVSTETSCYDDVDDDGDGALDCDDSDCCTGGLVEGTYCCDSSGACTADHIISWGWRIDCRCIIECTDAATNVDEDTGWGRENGIACALSNSPATAGATGCRVDS